MLGSLRLLLALAVAASHAGITLHGLNPGVIAVVGFYLISGYVMTGLLHRHYATPEQAGGFYLDRAVRLLPQYFLYAGLALVCYFVLHPESYHLSRPPASGDILNNLFVVPLNYYMWNDSDRFALVPPAWSLGAEIQFYLLAPWLLVRPRRVILAGLASLAVYACALTGLLNSDWFGYRLLPGVLSFFMLGGLLFHWHRSAPAQAGRRVALIVVMTVIALFLLRQGETWRQPFNRETLIGLLFGYAALHILATRARRRWDDLAGDVSYGVFLNHFLVLWVMFPGGVDSAGLPLFMGTCILLSWLTQRIFERPCLAWRKSLRTKGRRA